MPATVVSIGERTGTRDGVWCLLELARPGTASLPIGILFADCTSDRLTSHLLDVSLMGDLEEDEADILDFLGDDLRLKAAESGAMHLLDSLEDSLSHFLRIGDRTAICYRGDAERAAGRLFGEYVDSAVLPFKTHLPFYSLQAAATRFGESMDVEEEGWLRAPHGLRLTPDMFIARVVGRSMEPKIPDGSLCVFRSGVTGSRQGRLVLIEQFGETDYASRYTVKRYTSKKSGNEESWEHDRIRLEPLNPEFQAFNLGPDEFRVVAEFVAVAGE